MDSPILKRLFPLSPSVLHSHPTTLNAAFPPRSHDSSSVGYHVTQSELTRNLDLAVQAAWAARHSSRYVDVKVLLMSWASDDLGVKDEVQVLESVFRDLYNFDVENWTIPDEEPGLEAASKVLEFVKTGRHPDNLLILYYAGHALQSPNGGLPTWIANRSDDSPKFDSGCVQPHFCHGTEGSPDALLLYDSCHPANGHGSIKSGRPVIELLAACGFESTAAEVGRDSFTNSLIQELSHAASERRCISVPELHRRQICRLQSWAPSVSTGRDPRGNLKVAVGPDGSPILDVPRRRTPIHCQLSLNSRPRAIVLSPLPRSKGGPDFIQLDHVQKPADKNNPPELQVLLKVSIIEDKFNEADFKDWLCAAPPAAKEIKILGVLPSCSTLLLLRVPIEVWDMLSPSPAISFIGFVVSDTADPTESGGPSIPSAPSCLSTIDGNDSSGESEQTEYVCIRQSESNSGLPEKVVHIPSEEPVDDQFQEPGDLSIKEPALPPKSVNFAQTDDEKSLIEVLNSIDELLPSVFRRIRNKESLLNRENEEILVTDGVIGELQGLGTSSPSSATISLAKNVLSRSEYATIIRRYISARHLVEFDNPILDITSRLNRTSLLIWRDYDAVDEGRSSASGVTRSGKSSFWSGVKTLDTASSIVPVCDTPEEPSRLAALPARTHPTANTFGPWTYESDAYNSGLSDRNTEGAWMDKSPTVNYETNPTDRTFVQPTSFNGDLMPSIVDYLPDYLPDEFKIEKSSRFTPGQVFKAYWMEPMGVKAPLPRVPLGGGTEFSENMRVSDNIGQKIYIGFRKFIVVANDEGHCTCVPILTYERRGCTKSGVRASQHGIVYPVGGRAVMLKNEPRLGFPPIRIQLDGARARNEISKESRVNYSKLCTVEHNTRVVFIGRIVPQDFDIVQAAVDDCWEAKARSAGSKLRRKTTPDE